jgi:hypothetical protein
MAEQTLVGPVSSIDVLPRSAGASVVDRHWRHSVSAGKCNTGLATRPDDTNSCLVQSDVSRSDRPGICGLVVEPGPTITSHNAADRHRRNAVTVYQDDLGISARSDGTDLALCELDHRMFLTATRRAVQQFVPLVLGMRRPAQMAWVDAGGSAAAMRRLVVVRPRPMRRGARQDMGVHARAIFGEVSVTSGRRCKRPENAVVCFSRDEAVEEFKGAHNQMVGGE